MNIVFKSLELNNFLSFIHCEINLEDNGFVMVSGKNENKDDNAKSNGSGKSAIWEGISWALTGETIRSIKNVTNIFGNDGALVKLKFSADNNQYEIIRSKDHSVEKTNLKIIINGEDKSGKGIRDSEKLLAEYLPDMTSQLLGSVVLLGQGLPNRFSNNKPSGRKEVLERLSKSDFMIEDLKTRVATRRSALNESLKENEIETRNFEYSKNDAQNSVTNLEAQLQTLNETSKLFDDLELLKKQVDDKKIIVERLGKEPDTLSSQLAEIEKEFEDKISIIKKEYNDFVSEDKRIRESKVNELNELSVPINVLQEKIREINSIKLNCPTCGRPFDGVEKPDPKPFEDELEQLKKQQDVLKENIKKFNNESSIREEEILNKQKKYESEKYDATADLRNKIREKQNDYMVASNDYNIAYQNYLKIQSARDAYVEKITNIQNEITRKQNQIVDFSEKILYNNNVRDNLTTRQTYVNKMETFLKRDFRGALLENVIKYIEEQAKRYSLQVFDTDKINFELNGNDIDIKYCNKYYENLSGGEKQKIDIIIQLAIRDMLCKFLNFSSNIIVLDEVFDNLDEIGSQKILDLISNSMRDIDSIYIITHHTDIDIPFDKEVVVIKDNDGISKIRWDM